MKYRIFRFNAFRVLTILLLFVCGTVTRGWSTPPPIPVIANPDSGTVNSYNGNSNLLSAFVNDSFDNVPVVGSAMKVTFTSPDSHISMDTLTGVVSVGAGIMAGNYTLTYSICDTSNTINCSSSYVYITVTAPPIIAWGETATVNGWNGSANLLNVFGNDSINNITATLNAVTLSLQTPASNAGITLNVSTGYISVSPRVPAGDYTLVYKICDTLNTTNCDTALVEIKVTAPDILANSESVSANGYNGLSNAINVINNDSFNGALASLGQVLLTVVTPATSSYITLNTGTGFIQIAPHVRAGNYSLVYRICDSLNASNCDTATVWVTITAPPIIANDDNVSVNSFNGSLNVLNVYANDSINGIPATPTNVSFSLISSPSEPGVIMNISNGKISVFPMTPAGNYSFVYRLCDTANTGNCDTGTAWVTVTAPPIIANNDAANVNGYNGNASLLNVLSNDSLNNKSVSLSGIHLYQVTPASNTNISLNTGTGIISVTPRVAAGLYTISYAICDTLNTSSCDTGTASITVTSPVVAANADMASVNGYNGNSSLLNVYSNDQLNGSGFVAAGIKASLITPASTSLITFDTLTGNISVASPLAAGSYTLVYSICDTLNTSNCDTALVTIEVTSPAILAINDSNTVEGYFGADSVLTVWLNDSLNGLPVVSGAVKISVLTPATHANIVLDTISGVLSVDTLTPAGVYNLQYAICDTLNPANCSNAWIHLVVTPPLLEAIDDTIYVNGYDSNMYVLHVTSNDSLNGEVLPSASVWADTYLAASTPLIVLDTAFLDLSVLPRLAAGVYTFKYKIIDTLNLSNTDTASVVVFVSAPPIDAVTDIDTINGFTGDTMAVTVLSNDKLNNKTPDISEINLTTITGSGHPGVWLNDTTGIIKVAPLVPAGLYTITYEICDTLNTTNCDTTTDSLYITQPLIEAINDTAYISGYVSANPLLNILANDSIQKQIINFTQVKIKQISAPAHPGIELNDTTGLIKFTARVPAGIYNIDYSIEDTLNPGNTDTAHVYINVSAPPIIAYNDTAYVDGIAGGFSLLQVLNNDTLNSGMAMIPEVILHIIQGSGNNGITLDTASGILDVLPMTKSGHYTIVYSIEDSVNSNNRDTATLHVYIYAAPIIANAEEGSADGMDGNLYLLNVLSNDSINGNTVKQGAVTITVLQGATNPGIILNPANGLLSVFPNTSGGDYTIIYRLCDTLNPGNCDTAMVKIHVSSTPVVAINDSGYVNGITGSPYTLNVLENDSINNMPADIFLLWLNTTSSPSHPGITLDTTTGWVAVAAGTPGGIYTFSYAITDTLNPTHWDTAWIWLNVKTGDAVANDDSTKVNGYSGGNNLMNVTQNDHINGDLLTAGRAWIKILSPAAHPGVTLDTATGWISVAQRTPASLYYISYQIIDTGDVSVTDSAIAVVDVFAVGPVANPDSALTASGMPVTIYPLLNDMDPDTNLWPATIHITIMPMHGSATVDTINGTIEYTSDPGYIGDDTLYYSVCDSAMIPVLCAETYVIIHMADTMSLDTVYTTNLKCNGDTVGSATVVVKNGFPPYTITWNTTPVQTGATAINLPAGTYTAMVVDTLFDTLYVNATINQPISGLSAVAVTTQPLCNGQSNGKMTAVPSGGTPPYTYYWSTTGSILPTLDKIQAGNYPVIITDSNGCTLAKSFTLTEPAPLNITALIITDVVCKSSSDGNIQLAVSGGTSPYKFSWSSGDTTMDIYNKPPGTYLITVLDKNNCSTNDVYVINYSKENCEQSVFTPQGFSPDGDGINDEFVIDGIEKYPDNHLRIYNRWGSLVFEEHGYKNTWKGTSETGVGIGGGGQKLPTGTYYYILELEPGKDAISGYVYISK